MLNIAFPAIDDAPKVLQPGKQPFYFPAAPITTQTSAVLPDVHSFGPMRRDKLDSFRRKGVSEFVTIVSAVSNESSWSSGKKTLFESFVNKGDFTRRSTSCVNGDWKTISVCHCHDLGALSTTRFTDFGTPFFAPMNVASTKHSSRSILPRS
jgi:hypothetical protein